MLGIVIVEDEAIVRMELKSMLDWEKIGFVILGEAENGKKGLELILREKPDIVITDIKMPVMDGLEMIRSLKSQAPNIRYIILSSYEEFGLLKTAMNYGVTDYLIKLELTQEILKATLENQKKAILYENNALESKGISSISRVAQLLRQVLAGYYIREELDSTLKLANPAIDTRKLSCIAVRFSMPGKKTDFGENDRRTLEVSAHSIINDIVVTYFAGISFLADVGLCMFVYSPGIDGDKVAEMCGVVINMLRQYLNLASMVGVSSVEGGVENIHEIMIDSVKATEEVFFRGYGSIIFSSELVNDDMTGDDPILNSWAEPLRQALELRKPDNIKKIFDEALGLLSPPVQALLKRPEGLGAENPSRRRISRNSAFNLCFSMISIVLSVVKDARCLIENVTETGSCLKLKMLPKLN
jgi:two-component system response regulator YesN